MTFKRVLRPPGWSVWWVVGAALLGLILPAALAALLMLAGYYPVGSMLPRSVFWTEFGTFLVIDGCAAMILAAALIYSLLAWSWRPLALALTLWSRGDWRRPSRHGCREVYAVLGVRLVRPP